MENAFAFKLICCFDQNSMNSQMLILKALQLEIWLAYRVYCTVNLTENVGNAYEY